MSQKPDWGKRQVPYSRNSGSSARTTPTPPAKGYFRLAAGALVRLRYGDVVKCEGWHNGIVRCTYLPETHSGAPGADSVKVKGNIHWVSMKHAHAAQVHLYDRLLNVERPEGLQHLNLESKKTILAQLEDSLNVAGDDQFQFERHGYFISDESTPSIFNRTVTLRDSWSKAVINDGLRKK